MRFLLHRSKLRTFAECRHSFDQFCCNFCMSSFLKSISRRISWRILVIFLSFSLHLRLFFLIDCHFFWEDSFGIHFIFVPFHFVFVPIPSVSFHVLGAVGLESHATNRRSKTKKKSHRAPPRTKCLASIFGVAVASQWSFDGGAASSVLQLIFLPSSGHGLPPL